MYHNCKATDTKKVSSSLDIVLQYLYHVSAIRSHTQADRPQPLHTMQSATAPRLARLDAIEEGAHSFYRLAARIGQTGNGLRFDLRRKVQEAVQFSMDAGGSTFALPTKLQGTSTFQKSLAALGAIPHTYRKLAARFVPDTRTDKDGHRLALYFGGDCLGFLQDKHLPWMEALITDRDFILSGVQVYALQVTGGEPGRPTRGLNVVITGIGERAAKVLDWAEAARIDAEAEAEAEQHATLPDY